MSLSQCLSHRLSLTVSLSQCLSHCVSQEELQLAGVPVGAEQIEAERATAERVAAQRAVAAAAAATAPAPAAAASANVQKKRGRPSNSEVARRASLKAAGEGGGLSVVQVKPKSSRKQTTAAGEAKRVPGGRGGGRGGGGRGRGRGGGAKATGSGKSSGVEEADPAAVGCDPAVVRWLRELQLEHYAGVFALHQVRLHQHGALCLHAGLCVDGEREREWAWWAHAGGGNAPAFHPISLRDVLSS